MKIISTIICDDVRREITGKDIIIGAYSGTIIVPTVPFELPLAVWIEMMPDDVGQHIVYVRLNYAGQELFTAQLGLNIHAPGGLALPVTGLFLRGDKVGDLSVDFSEDQKTWAEIKRKSVITGEVKSVLPPPTVSG